MIATWIHSLSKTDLVQCLTELEQDANGSVEELRKKFKAFIAEEGNLKKYETILSELQAQFTPSVSILKPPPASQSRATSPISHSTQSRANSPIPRQMADRIENQGKIMHQVWKWSVKFDGKTLPWNFIERVEELADAYNKPLDLLPQTMPELLTEKALLWYHNNNRRWNTWREFKSSLLEFFLPASGGHHKRPPPKL